MTAKIVCTAEVTGPEMCPCPECAAMLEADHQAEWLAEMGANYAYSGHNASDAMTMARNDLRTLKLRANLPAIRKQYARERRAWATSTSEAEASEHWVKAFRAFQDGYEATGRIVDSFDQLEREFAAAMGGWVRMMVREGRI